MTETPRDRLEYAAHILAADNPWMLWTDAISALADSLHMSAAEIVEAAAGDFEALWQEAIGDQEWQQEIRDLIAAGYTKAAQARARHRYLEGLPTNRVRKDDAPPRETQ